MHAGRRCTLNCAFRRSPYWEALCQHLCWLPPGWHPEGHWLARLATDCTTAALIHQLLASSCTGQKPRGPPSHYSVKVVFKDTHLWAVGEQGSGPAYSGAA
jgi:hypothetical protein